MGSASSAPRATKKTAKRADSVIEENGAITFILESIKYFLTNGNTKTKLYDYTKGEVMVWQTSSAQSWMSIVQNMKN